MFLNLIQWFFKKAICKNWIRMWNSFVFFLSTCVKFWVLEAARKTKICVFLFFARMQYFIWHHNFVCAVAWWREKSRPVRNMNKLFHFGGSFSLFLFFLLHFWLQVKIKVYGYGENRLQNLVFYAMCRFRCTLESLDCSLVQWVDWSLH